MAWNETKDMTLEERLRTKAGHFTPSEWNEVQRLALIGLSVEKHEREMKMGLPPLADMIEAERRRDEDAGMSNSGNHASSDSTITTTKETP